MNRRNFIKTTGMISAGTLLYACAPDPKSAPPNIGLALYTVRDGMAEDPKATLKRVADIGYKELEAAGFENYTFWNTSPGDLKMMADDLGLELISCHLSTGWHHPDVKGTLTNEFEKAIESIQEAGFKYVIVPWVHEDFRTYENYVKLIDLLNPASEYCKKAGIVLGYHHHEFEFERLNNEVIFDKILAETDPELVKIEMDMYWMTHAGKDPVEYFEKHPGRIPLWHVKDMDNATDKNFTEVGSGIIDFKPIFANAEKSGMKHYFVEQDKTPGDPFDSIIKSYDYVKTIV